MKEITLSQGKIALVDDEDYETLTQVKWSAEQHRKTWYAAHAEKGTRRKRRMHQDILHAPQGFVIDHKNGNGLDNRRVNLRVCTRAQNGANSGGRGGTSKYKGVTWSRNAKKWMAHVKYQRRHIYLGYFAIEEDAALAYNAGAFKLLGEFAFLNVIESPSTARAIDFCDSQDADYGNESEGGSGAYTARGAGSSETLPSTAEAG